MLRQQCLSGEEIARSACKVQSLLQFLSCTLTRPAFSRIHVQVRKCIDETEKDVVKFRNAMLAAKKFVASWHETDHVPTSLLKCQTEFEDLMSTDCARSSQLPKLALLHRDEI